MSIKPIYQTTELSSREEFMEKFAQACGEKDLMGDEVTVTINTVHRQDVDAAASTLALRVNDQEQFCTALTLKTDQIIEICDVLLTDTNVKVPSFATRQFQTILYSIYSAECDDIATSLEIAEAIDPQSAYQGLSSEIIIECGIDQEIYVTLNVYAEYYLDTTKAELELLKEKGLVHLHSPSDPNHRALLFSFHTGTIQKP